MTTLTRVQQRPAERTAHENENGFRELGVAILVASIAIVPIFGYGSWSIRESERSREAARLAEIEAALAYERLIGAEALPMRELSDAVHGRDLFASACIACHGADGAGVEGLGKNLVTSDFVARQTDDELHEFITKGRPNAQPIGMPPKGGHDELTDGDLQRIVAYIRGLQDPRRMPELPAVVAVSTAPSEAETADALAAAGGDAELAEYIAHGTKLFGTTCVACHGAGGVGVKGSGKALANSLFVQGMDDDALLAFIKKGRDPSDPGNTTGIGMPPKGGNPALSDDDILDVIEYLRTLQTKKTTASAGQ